MDRLLTVRIDEDLHQKVKMATVAQGITVADVVRGALNAFVAKAGPIKKAKAAPAKAAKKPAAKKAAPKKAAAKKPAKKGKK